MSERELPPPPPSYRERVAPPVAPRPAVYFWARACVVVFSLVAGLSVIGGIAIGVEASKETTNAGDLLFEETTYDGAVLAIWIFAGIFSAFMWVGLAVGIELLRRSAASLDRLSL